MGLHRRGQGQGERRAALGLMGLQGADASLGHAQLHRHQALAIGPGTGEPEGIKQRPRQEQGRQRRARATHFRSTGRLMASSCRNWPAPARVVTW